MVFAIYSHAEHPLTKLNESKCIRYRRIGRGFASLYTRREYEVCPIAAVRRVGRELLSKVPRPKLK